ncbi:MAG: hypothetical protein P8Z31_06695, partial [Gammaproteobacteria bacterium]
AFANAVRNATLSRYSGLPHSRIAWIQLSLSVSPEATSLLTFRAGVPGISRSVFSNRFFRQRVKEDSPWNGAASGLSGVDPVALCSPPLRVHADRKVRSRTDDQHLQTGVCGSDHFPFSSRDVVFG